MLHLSHFVNGLITFMCHLFLCHSMSTVDINLNIGLTFFTIRYRIKVRVFDHTGNAIFVIFDREGKFLFNKSASEMYEVEDKVYFVYLLAKFVIYVLLFTIRIRIIIRITIRIRIFC